MSVFLQDVPSLTQEYLPINGIVNKHTPTNHLDKAQYTHSKQKLKTERISR